MMMYYLGNEPDEKIVSAALTKALSKNINILSSDFDLKRMLNFFLYDKVHKSKFRLPYINYSVRLYSESSRGYDMVKRWFGKWH